WMSCEPWRCKGSGMPYRAGSTQSRSGFALFSLLLVIPGSVRAQESQVVASPHFRAVSVKPGLASKSGSFGVGQSIPGILTATPYPRPPLTGFLPLVAATLSDRHKTGDLVWAHDLQTTFVGGSLNAPSSTNWVLAVVDSG